MTDQDRVPQTSTKIRRWALKHWVALTLVLVAAVYGGAVTLLHGDAESPIDETVYLDYTYKVWDQGLVHQGEKFGPDIAHRVGCDTVVPHGALGQECGSDTVNLEALPNGGYTTGSGYTPVYFWTVRIIGDPIHALTGLSEVSSWRMSGVVWLIGTVLLLSTLLRRAGASNLAALALGVVFIASPYVWWTNTYVSTDVSVVPFGAAVLLVAMEARKGRLSPWWLVPLGVLAPIFKITNLLVFGVGLLYLLIDTVARWWLRRKSGTSDESAAVAPSRRMWLPVLLAAALAAVVQVVWMRLVPLLAVSDVIVDQGVTVPLTGSQLVGLAMSGIAGPITHNPFAGYASTPLFGMLFMPLTWLAIASVIGALMVIPWDAERGPVIWATAIGSVAALPMLAILMWVTTGTYFPLPARYGAGVIPAVLVVGGYMLRNRVTTCITLAYAGVLMAVGVVLAVHIGITY
ncbi:MAG: hypothetical protein ACTHNQ_01255 [Microbacterium sp.]|uniref:hypothetical protein n=1 Tax=Microbacterium sp. TaxID=51671 RepID=UPI003F7D83D2